MDILLMPLMLMGTLFITVPFAALVPAIIFFFSYMKFRKVIVLIPALFWCIYTIYEYAMYLRILCTGECNIRIDLLLIYPFLIIISIIGIIGIAFQFRKTKVT